MQKSMTSNSTSSQSTSPEPRSPNYLTLSKLKPEKVKQLADLVRDRGLWDPLEELLMLVRQGYLEEMVVPDLSSEDRLASCAVIAFIDRFVGEIRENLIDEQAATEREAMTDPDEESGNQHMHISEDFEPFDDETVSGLTEN